MAGFPPRKNSAFTFYTALVSQADTDIFKTSPTLAAGDVKVSIDGGNFTNIGTLPVQIETTGVLPVALTAAEMNGDVIVVKFVDAAGAEWQDQVVTIFTDAVQLADIKAKTDNLPSDPADESALEAAITSAVSTLATSAALATVSGKIDTVDDYLDTEIAAILADTNELQVDWVNGGRLDLLIDGIKAKTDTINTGSVSTSTAAVKTFDIGDVVRETGTYTVNSVATDPTTVTLTVRTPTGTETSYTYAAGTVTKSSTGIYYKDLTMTESGWWSAYWKGTGACATAGEDRWFVRKSEIV